MRQPIGTRKSPGEKIVKDIKRATRKVLSWRLSNTMDASFCKEALDVAITKYGPP